MLPDRMFSTFQTASQGLAHQREKISAASRNIANANTTAPEGSRDAYSPQRVKGEAIRPTRFRDVLMDSVSNLQRTHPGHLSSDSPGGGRISSRGQGPQGLGPRFDVVENGEFRMEYDPSHPDANEEGMVQYPEVDLIREMTELVSANRLYEANLSSIEAEKEIIKRSLEI